MTEDGLKRIVREAVAEAVPVAMADKIERTFGIDCREPEDRAAVRKDMEFLRLMRLGTNRGAEKALLWLLGLFGASAVAYLWPDIARHLK